MTDAFSGRGSPPSPDDVHSYDELAARLQELRAWSGTSYRALHREVVRSRRQRRIAELPAFDTVHRCLQPGRARVDVELVVDIAAALLGDREQATIWRQACQAAALRVTEASLVSVLDTLPADEPHFTGRRSELARILGATGGQHGAVVSITGMGGIGKTRLAVHAAHLLAEAGHADDFRLCVDLRGYDTGRPPAQPAAVLDGFLRRLGVPGSQLPHLDLAARRARLQELLAGRSALLLLDNAASADQVRPLLPGLTSCRVIVTSRAALPGIGATEVPLDVFSSEEAVSALQRAAAPVRVDPTAEPTTRILALVGHLPLAIALVGARIRGAAGWTLEDHAERLAEAHESGKLDAAVELALRLSYDRLPPEQRRLLRLVSTHPGRDLDRHAAAALAEATCADTDAALAGLVEASVIRSHGGDRYTLHDLVRAFAAERACEEDPPSARRAAAARLMDFYDVSAARAARLFSPQTDLDVPVPPALSGATGPKLDDRDDAQRWFDVEWQNLLAVAFRASEVAPAYVVHLSAYLQRYLDVTGRMHEAEALHARAAAVAEGDSRARSLVNLAIVHFQLGQHQAAEAPLREALPIHRSSGNRAAESKVLNNLGLVHQHNGDYDEARRHFEAALVMAPSAVVELFPLGNLAKLCKRLGHPDEALAYALRAHEAARSLEDPTRQAQTLYTVGNQLRAMDRFEEALAPLSQSLELARESHFAFCEAYALNALGLVRCALGDHSAALTLHEEALSVTREFEMTQVETEVLNDLGGTLCRMGRAREALDRHEEALRSALASGDRQQQARAHEGIGDALAQDSDGKAHDAWRRARDEYAALGLPDAERLAPRLAEAPDRH